MKVYVLETGVYEDRSVCGVFASAEAAMAAWQPKQPQRERPEPQAVTRYDSTTGQTTTGWETQRPWNTYTWSAPRAGEWVFDADFDDHATVTEHELQR